MTRTLFKQVLKLFPYLRGNQLDSTSVIIYSLLKCCRMLDRVISL